jgi:hypothetical protein
MNNPKFEIQHYTLCDGWVNTWSNGETGEPTTYDDYHQAADDLADFLDQEAEAYFNGYIESRYHADEFQIVEIKA